MLFGCDVVGSKTFRKAFINDDDIKNNDKSSRLERSCGESVLLSVNLMPYKQRAFFRFNFRI